MKTLVSTGIKLLGLWMLFHALQNGIFHTLADESQAFSEINPGRIADLLLPFIFGLMLIFRTGWIIQVTGCEDLKEASFSITWRDGLKAGLILIGINQLLFRVPYLITTLLGSYFGFTGLLTDLLIIVAAGFMVFRTDAVIRLILRDEDSNHNAPTDR